jgi:hypothetical protein
MFDEIGAAEIAADLTITALLEPNRAARTVAYNARNKANPHFREVVEGLLIATWRSPLPSDAKQAAVKRAVQSLTVARLMDLAADSNAHSQVRAVASDALRSINSIAKRRVVNPDTATHYRAASDDIERFLSRPDAPRKQTTPLATPPGDPIGGN